MIFVHTLGTAQIDVGEMRVVPTSPRKFALLLYLAAERGRRITRAELQDLIFPDQTEKNARHSLRELTYQLRQAGAVVDSDANGVALLAAGIRMDFAELIAKERPGADQLRAVEGGFLPGYAPEHSEAFGEWFAGFRAQTTFEVCRALLREVARARSVGDWMLTERAARACLALDQLNEEATLALAEMLAIGGAKAQAFGLLDRYSEEVGPGAPTLRLPASLVRRRISERVKDTYRVPLTLPFLGRDPEMTALNECLDRARSGASQCVMLVGDAGIGKSRLADEFCTRAALDGARVESVLRQPHDTHRPMGTIADLVPGLLQLPGALGCSPGSMTALQRLTLREADDRGLAQTPAQSEAVAASITRAIADLADAIAAEAPVILFVDDAQWADDLSLRTLSTLVSARHQRRLLVVLASRDRNLRQRLAQTTEHFIALSIAPIGSGALTEMLERVFDPDGTCTDANFRSWLAYASGGNPFFLRCLVGHFQTTGERFVVPTSVSSLLDHQLSSLTSAASTVLGMCVALGRYSDIDRLVAALDLPEMQLQLAIRELEAAHLVAQMDRRIEPAHWLVAEAVNRSTSPIAFRLLHRRVAVVLGREVEVPSVGPLWDCAEHWILAGENERASALMSQCADHSINIGRPREAVATLLRAAALLHGHNPAGLVTRAVRLADAAGESDLVLRAAKYAHSQSLLIDYDGFELAEIQAQISERDDTARAKEALRRWLGADRPLHHRLKAGMLSLILADTDFDPDFAHEARAALNRELIVSVDCEDASVLKFLLIYHSRFGDNQESLRVARQLLSLAERLGPSAAADLQRKSAVAILGVGEIKEGRAALESAYASARASGLVRLQCSVASLLAGVSIDDGNDNDAARWMAEVEELADEIEGYRTSLAYVALLADNAAGRGDARLARHWLDVGMRHMAEMPTARTKRWFRALEMRVRQLDNEPMNADDIVVEMIGTHLINAEAGDLSDLETAVAVMALAEDNRAPEARSVLTRYVTLYRRSGGPFAINLKVAAAQVGWDRPTGSPTHPLTDALIRSEGAEAD